MGTTINYGLDYNIENSNDWWNTWEHLWEFVDAELAYRTKDLNMKGFTLYGSEESGGDLVLNSTSHATKGQIIAKDLLQTEQGISLIAQIVPSDPPSNSMIVYIKASGTTPNREVAYCIKDETGSEMIVTSVLI